MCPTLHKVTLTGMRTAMLVIRMTTMTESPTTSLISAPVAANSIGRVDKTQPIHQHQPIGTMMDAKMMSKIQMTITMKSMTSMITALGLPTPPLARLGSLIPVLTTMAMVAVTAMKTPMMMRMVSATLAMIALQSQVPL